MFLTWEWLYTWFKHLREDRELLILRLSHGEETVGLVPMAIRPHILDNFLGVRVVGFLGMGKAGADYLDVIIRRGWEEHALAALDKFAEENTSLVLRLAQIKKDSFAFRWAARLEHQGWRVSRAKTNVCPFIRLSGHFLAIVPGKLGIRTSLQRPKEAQKSQHMLRRAVRASDLGAAVPGSPFAADRAPQPALARARGLQRLLHISLGFIS
jgi:hypothetical protein